MADNKTGADRTPRVAKVRVPLDFKTITVVKANRDQMAAHKRTRGANAVRDKDQLAVDKIVNSAYAAWESAGKPEGWDLEAGHGILVRVPESAVETITWRIRRAASFYDVKVRFGGVITEKGYAEVAFIVTDKPETAGE